MVAGRFEYQAPRSLKEALSLLDEHDGRCKILAGGTDLIVQIKSGQINPDLIVDVKKIPELNRVEYGEDRIFHIGAAVPLSRLLMFPSLIEKAGILIQACSALGSVQVRNRATMGGNICNAAPSADTPPALLCLAARAAIASLKGTRTIPLEDFFLAPGQTALERGELLVEVMFSEPSTASAGYYLKHTPREEMDIAVMGVASFLTLSPEGKTLSDAKIALAAVAPTPLRVPQAESNLIGRTLTPAIIEETADRAAEAARPISDLRSSDAYRKEMVRALTGRSLRAACKDLGITIG